MFKHVFYEVNKYLISTSDQYICETVMTWEWSIVTWAAELGIGNHGLGASASTKRHLCVICVMPLVAATACLLINFRSRRSPNSASKQRDHPPIFIIIIITIAINI